MLVSFSVSNYRSFDEEETFSLVASKTDAGEHPGHAAPIPNSDERVLRLAVLYGANAAGKSNLVKALASCRQVAIEPRSRSQKLEQQPFLQRRDGRLTSFDVQFVASNHHYRYFVAFDELRIARERLARVVDGQEILVFERSTSESNSVDVQLGVIEGWDEGRWERISALAKVGGLADQSFLATVFATLGREEWPPHFENSLGWFISGLSLIFPDGQTSQAKAGFATSADLREFAGEFLKAASTGVDRLVVRETPLSEDDVLALPMRVRLRSTPDSSDGTSFHILSDGDVLLGERSGDKVSHRLVNVEAAHRDRNGEVISFPLEQESDGTQRLMQLMPGLSEMRRRQGCYFIDELDRSLHPILVRDFLVYFLGSCQAQLIVTTHESSLLDRDLLRRDEIWFAEKNREGATTLYSLLDFDPRNDHELRKNYLQGRFGAIPFVGRVEDLLNQEIRVD